MGHATAHTVHPRGPPRAGLCMTRLAIIRHRRTARTVYRHACTSAMALQRRRGTQQCRQAAHTPGARHTSRNKGALAPQNGFRANCNARPAHTIQIRATCSGATLFPPKTFFARPVMATAPCTPSPHRLCLRLMALLVRFNPFADHERVRTHCPRFKAPLFLEHFTFEKV